MSKLRFRILTISQEELMKLLEYSTTNPTGTTTGKRWRCNLNVYKRGLPPLWIVCEYLAPEPDPEGRPGWHVVPIRYYCPVIQ